MEKGASTHSRLGRRTLLGATLGGAAAAGLLPARTRAASTEPGGFSPAGLQIITKGLQQFIDRGDAVGYVTLLYRHGAVAQVNTLGWRDREAKAPMRRDTIFRIASMTKPVTGVATLALVEDGKLALNDRVDKWLPELSDRKVLNTPDGPLNETHPAPRPITVADLLTHRSGIIYDFTATGPMQAALEQALPRASSASMTPDQWMKALGTLPLAFDPGARWQYGLSFDVLGVLIERVSGMKFADFLEQRLFTPLGMKDTGFWLPKAKLGRLAAMYGLDMATGRRPPAPGPAPDAPPAFPSGGGGLLSTADDYLKFARMLLGQGKVDRTRILAHQSVALMTANWLTPEQRKIPFMGLDFWSGQGFGLGISIIDDITHPSGFGFASKGSFGWPGAFGTWWQVDPKEDMIMIYLVQNAATLGPKALGAAFHLGQPQALFQTLTYKAIDD